MVSSRGSRARRPKGGAGEQRGEGELLGVAWCSSRVKLSVAVRSPGATRSWRWSRETLPRVFSGPAAARGGGWPSPLSLTTLASRACFRTTQTWAAAHSQHSRGAARWIRSSPRASVRSSTTDRVRLHECVRSFVHRTAMQCTLHGAASFDEGLAPSLQLEATPFNPLRSIPRRIPQ